MSTSVPTKFTGTAVLTPEKVAIINDWYVMSLDYSDMVTDAVEAAIYKAQARALEETLKLIHEQLPKNVEKVAEKAAKSIAKAETRSGGGNKKLILLVAVGAGLYLYTKNRPQVDKTVVRVKESVQDFSVDGKKEGSTWTPEQETSTKA